MKSFYLKNLSVVVLFASLAIPAFAQNRADSTQAQPKAAVVADSSRAATVAAPAVAEVIAPLSVLNSLLVKSGLDSVLKAGGLYTVFAPSNEAFAKSGIVLDSLSGEQLKNVLLSHVAQGNLETSGVVKDTSLTTLAGTTLKISKIESGISVNGLVSLASDDSKQGNVVTHTISEVIVAPKTAPIVEKVLTPAEAKKKAAADKKAGKKVAKKAE